MKNTIDKIVTVQQALVTKVLKVKQVLAPNILTESEVEEITMTLNELLANAESIGSGGGSQPTPQPQPDPQPDTPSTSIYDEIPGANPNYKALYVTGLDDIIPDWNRLVYPGIYNNGYYIPVCEDGAPLTERKYVLAVKFNDQIYGYRMFEYTDMGSYGTCWRYTGAELNEDNKFVSNGQFESVTYKFGDDDLQYSFENILELEGLESVYGEEGYEGITIQERDWNTFESLPNVISTEDDRFLFKITGCTGEGESINGYYSLCPKSNLEEYFIIEEQQYIPNGPVYANVNNTFVVYLTDTETRTKHKFILISLQRDKYFAYDTTSNDYTGIQPNTIINLKENIGTPSITNLQ